MIRRLALALLAAAAALTPAAGQVTERWDVRSSAAVDLWYHGLALVGYDGPGPLSWYSADYARDVRADRARRGLHTLLDRDGAVLCAAFRRDSTFEALHFLPLYFPGEWPERLLDLVRAVSGGDLETRQGVSPPRRGADAASVAALRAVFVTAEQRRVLHRFAEALDDEWRRYLRDYRARDARAVTARLHVIRATWSADVEPAVRDNAGWAGIRRGTILVAAPLGAEGRLLRAGDGVVVAVQLPPGDTLGLATALSAVRELCFSTALRAGASPATVASRHAASEASSRDAAWCGARLVGHRPDLTDAYRALFHAALTSRREP